MQTKVAESKNRILAYMNTINNQIFAKSLNNALDSFYIVIL